MDFKILAKLKFEIFLYTPFLLYSKILSYNGDILLIIFEFLIETIFGHLSRN